MKTNYFILLMIIYHFSTTSSLAQTALDFDSSVVGQQVKIPEIICPTEFTFEAWVYFRGGTDLFPTILEFGNDAPFIGLEYDESLPNSNVFTLFGVISDTAPFPENQWVHIAVSYSTLNSEAKLYINGSIRAKETSVTLDVSGVGAGIGYNNNDDVFNGSIDDVAIWNIVRTKDEISSSISTCLTGSEIGLYAFYNFNEGSAQWLMI